MLKTRLVSEERLERRHTEGVEGYDGSRGRYQAPTIALDETQRDEAQAAALLII
jgi:hypothetical protein